MDLVRLAIELGAMETGGPPSRAEQRLARLAEVRPRASNEQKRKTAREIDDGHDPLGSQLLELRGRSERRLTGAFYTPRTIADLMVTAILDTEPAQVVDPGCGSGRFTIEIARRNPTISVFAIDSDPVATLVTRAGLSTVKSRNAQVFNMDYRQFRMPAGDDRRTAFISNPPYVRHHSLDKASKDWAIKAGRKFGINVSSLSGLHVHFLLATAILAKPGDRGCFITSSEWLDVAYGSAIRQLCIKYLGLTSIDVIDPKTSPFGDVMSTASISSFHVGSRPPAVRVSQSSGTALPKQLAAGREISSAELADLERWGPTIRKPTKDQHAGHILGDAFRVHRGLVTGANRFFVMSKNEARLLGLAPWCHPAITSADEILDSGGVVRDSPARKVVVAIPSDLDIGSHPEVADYIRQGEHRNGAHAISERYVTSHRQPWWHLGRLPRPPVVATYMARRPPTFALNPDGLTILNIAHGLYPKLDTPGSLPELVAILNGHGEAFSGLGRTYQGGLEKFEPREMEALPLNGAYEKWLKRSSQNRRSGMKIA